MSLHSTQPATKAPPGAAGVRQRRPKRTGDLGVAILFILPASVGFGLFFLWPTIRGIYLSFTDYSLFGSPTFVGLDNYKKLANDDVFWNALKVTVEYVVINIGLQTIFAIILANLMFRLTKSALVRGVIMLPYLIANVVVALVFLWTLDYQIGIVNTILDQIGLGRVAWFGQENLAIPTIALVNVWRHVGYTALLIFAGLQMIPNTVYEAAAIDGSSEWRTFWRITMPLLRPVMVLVLVLTIIGSFQIFDTVAVTTKGGPVNASRVIQYYIWEQAFGRSHFGYAAAISAVLFLILAGVAFAQMRLLRAGESDLA
jgi:multiple sugar transport system permease protein